MDDYEIEDEVTIHRVYIQPTPTNTTQLGKLQSHILQDLEANKLSYADDRIIVTPGDEDIRFTFEIASGTQKEVLEKLTQELDITRGEYNDLKARWEEAQVQIVEQSPAQKYDVLGDPAAAPVGTVVTGLSLTEGSRFRQEDILRRNHTDSEAAYPWKAMMSGQLYSHEMVSQRFEKLEVLRWGPRP